MTFCQKPSKRLKKPFLSSFVPLEGSHIRSRVMNGRQGTAFIARPSMIRLTSDRTHHHRRMSRLLRRKNANWSWNTSATNLTSWKNHRRNKN